MLTLQTPVGVIHSALLVEATAAKEELKSFHIALKWTQPKAHVTVEAL